MNKANTKMAVEEEDREKEEIAMLLELEDGYIWMAIV